MISQGKGEGDQLFEMKQLRNNSALCNMPWRQRHWLEDSLKLLPRPLTSLINKNWNL